MKVRQFIQILILLSVAVFVAACGNSAPPPAVSANTYLDNIILSEGTFDKPFTRGTNDYSVVVAHEVTGITVTPTVEEPSARVSVNGNVVASGRASQEVLLDVGDNRVTVVVTAQDGSTHRTYTLIVTRTASGNALLAGLSLSTGEISGFTSSKFDYSVTVENHVDLISVTATPVDEVTLLKVNDVNVTPGQPSAKISLKDVTERVIRVDVLAQDGISSKTYTIIVKRDALMRGEPSYADLRGLVVSTGALYPPFSSAQTSYDVTVANSVTSIRVTPTAADSSSSIAVGDATVYSGDESGEIPLNVGNNSISVLVTAIDSKTKEYVIHVYREPRTNANLSGIDLSAGTLTPSFNSGVTEYTATFYYSENVISISPLTEDPAASFTVKDVAPAEGQTSINMSLSTGNNNIPVVVTAQDGTTQKTYTLTLIRQPGDNASLTSLELSDGMLLTPSFSSDVYDYSIDVDNTVTSLSVTPSSDNPYTQIRVNGNPFDSGQMSQAVSLLEGPNVVTVNTTSENTLVKIAYRINVYRQRISPVFSGGGSFNIDENVTLVGNVVATQDGGATVTYQLTGGVDQAHFSIDSSTGELNFNSAPDYEAPSDGDVKNTYEVEVTAYSTVNSVEYSTSNTFIVNVNDVDEAPVFNTTGDVSVPENETIATTIDATDLENDTLSFALTGGDDQSLFVIDPTTGVLSFQAAPDFENPLDADTLNDYIVEVTVTSVRGAVELSSSQLFTVTVSNIDEAPQFTSATGIDINENIAAVLTVAAEDPEAADVAAYSISGGEDQALFTIDSVTGDLSFLTAPNYEAAADFGADNLYKVDVTASFTINATPVEISQSLQINVLDVDEAPVFTSTLTPSVPEGTGPITNLAATDPEGGSVTFSVTGGADIDFFTFYSPNDLRFKYPGYPSFEVPKDANGDNVYEIEITASDGVNNNAQIVSVEVTDIFDMDVVATGIDQVSLLWSNPGGAAYYRLYEDPDGISGYSQMGSDLVDTSIVFDLSVHLTNWRNAKYHLDAYDASDVLIDSLDGISILPAMLDAIGYFKAHNPDRGDLFGSVVRVSDDGNTFVVGAPGEDNAAWGIDPTDGNASGSASTMYATNRGAIYVFSKNSGSWVQEAYIKTSIGGSSALLDEAQLGSALALSADGNTIAAYWQGDGKGRIFIFTRSGSTWSQQTYFSPPNLDDSDFAGKVIALSKDGATLAFTSPGEDSNGTSIGLGGSTDNSLSNSGAVYVYKYDGLNWNEEAFIKAETPVADSTFGSSLAVSSNGDTLVIGDSSAGSVFKYSRTGSTWRYDYSIVGSNTEAVDLFGTSLDLSDDGLVLAVGAPYEQSGSITLNSGETDNSTADAGAVYLFDLGAGSATQTAYIKPWKYNGSYIRFGSQVSLSGNGLMLAVAAPGDDGTTPGVDGNGYTSGFETGAVYMYENSGGWVQRNYVKSPIEASHARYDDFANIDLNSDGSRLVVGASRDDSYTSGINSNPAYSANTWYSWYGAVFVY